MSIYYYYITVHFTVIIILYYYKSPLYIYNIKYMIYNTTITYLNSYNMMYMCISFIYNGTLDYHIL